MNKSLISIIAAIVIVGGLAYFVGTRNNAPDQQASLTPATSTTPETGGGSTAIPPQADAPLVETNPNATPSNSTALVTGRVNPNGRGTAYWYEYGVTTALGTRTASQNIGSGFTFIPSPAFITGLRASTQYFYRLSGQNNLGTVNGATHTFTTSRDNPPPQGNTPTTETTAASTIARTTANLNGRVNPRGAGTSYWFEYGTTSELGTITAIQSAGSGTVATPVSVSISGLNPATRYFFRINAQNQFGTVNGATREFTTLGPANPAAPAAKTDAVTNITASSAAFHGQVNPRGAETTYWFEYSKDSLLGNIIGTATVAQLAGSGAEDVAVSANASGLDSNTKYFVRLVARNSQGTTKGNMETFKTSQ